MTDREGQRSRALKRGLPDDATRQWPTSAAQQEQPDAPPRRRRRRQHSERDGQRDVPSARTDPSDSRAAASGGGQLDGPGPVRGASSAGASLNGSSTPGRGEARRDGFSQRSPGGHDAQRPDQGDSQRHVSHEPQVKPAPQSAPLSQHGSPGPQNPQDGGEAGTSAGKVQGKKADRSARAGRAALIAALAAQVFVLLGCLGPWASLFGTSVSGMKGHGSLIFVLAFVAIGFGLTKLVGNTTAKLLWCLVAVSTLSFVIALVDYGKISSLMTVGWGLLFVIAFSFVSAAAGIFAAWRD